MTTERSIHDAQHPIRQCAIKIIEEVVIPALQDDTAPFEGASYYTVEDKITDLIYKLINK